MDINLANVNYLIGIIVALGGLFWKFALKPLNEDIKKTREDMKLAMDRWTKSIERNTESLERIENKRQDMETRLARVEESTKSAHHRINYIELTKAEQLRDFEARR